MMKFSKNDGEYYDDQTGEIYTNIRGTLVPSGRPTKDPDFLKAHPAETTFSQKPQPLNPSTVGSTPVGSEANWTDRQKLEAQAIGQTPAGYQGIFQKVYNKNLGQPGEIGAQWYITGTQELAEAFIDRYLEKNGKMPDAGTIKDFVAKNLDENYAKNYIQGGINRDQVKTQYVDPYLDNLKQEELIKQQNDPAYQQSQLEKSVQVLNRFYDPLQEQALADVKRQFNPLRARAADEEAALGRLRSGVSAAPEAPIQQVDAQQGNAFSKVISDILGQKAGGVLDYSKFGQNQATTQQQIANAKNEFNQTFGFNKQQYSDQLDYQNRALALQDMIARQQAEARKPGTLDYLGAAFGGLGALGSLATGAGIARKAFKS